jgi:hypothetical protein
MAKFLSAVEAGEALGFSDWTMKDCCALHPGFAFRLRPGGAWRIPQEHIARVRAGELVSEIARNPSLPSAPPPPKASTKAQPRRRWRRARRPEASNAP